VPSIAFVERWSIENNICLGQIKVAEQSNEITAIPQLLAVLDIQVATITTGAMGCQFKIANQIVNAKADYVLALKGS
jgi:predicted transposase YbfD/YdcC